jgi:hypothetical protein
VVTAKGSKLELLMVIRDVVTHWNYTHAMIKRALMLHKVSSFSSVFTSLMSEFIIIQAVDQWCKGNLTDLRRILHLSLAKGNPK